MDSLKYVATLKLPAVKALRLGTFLKKAQDQLEVFETVRRKLIQEHGVKQGDTDNYTLSPEALPEFSKAFEEVLNEEVKLEVPKFDLSDVTKEKFDFAKIARLYYLIHQRQLQLEGGEKVALEVSMRDYLNAVNALSDTAIGEVTPGKTWRTLLMNSLILNDQMEEVTKLETDEVARQQEKDGKVDNELLNKFRENTMVNVEIYQLDINKVEEELSGGLVSSILWMFESE